MRGRRGRIEFWIVATVTSQSQRKVLRIASRSPDNLHHPPDHNHTACARAHGRLAEVCASRPPGMARASAPQPGLPIWKSSVSYSVFHRIGQPPLEAAKTPSSRYRRAILAGSVPGRCSPVRIGLCGCSRRIIACLSPPPGRQDACPTIHCLGFTGLGERAFSHPRPAGRMPAPNPATDPDGTLDHLAQSLTHDGALRPVRWWWRASLDRWRRWLSAGKSGPPRTGRPDSRPWR